MVESLNSVEILYKANGKNLIKEFATINEELVPLLSVLQH